MEPKEWLVDWFTKRAGVDRREVAAASHQNYFERGWIDSIHFIELIGDVEETYGIRFRQDDFQDRPFSTIDGLAIAIERRRGPHGS